MINVLGQDKPTGEFNWTEIRIFQIRFNKFDETDVQTVGVTLDINAHKGLNGHELISK